MTRPLRLEFPGALYHVTARGVRRTSIFLDDNDRQQWIDILGLVCVRFNFVVHAYCQMGNHYHLMIETVEGNLSQGMRQLNAFYSQAFNRQHGLVGHVLQGRYKAILVQKESYLLELARYVVLNPVRAGLVDDPRDWFWGSYSMTMGERDAPQWLNTVWLLSQFGESRELACPEFRQFVLGGIGRESPLKETKHQLILGDQAFVTKHRERFGSTDFTAVIKDQRRVAAMTLPQYEKTFPDRDEAMARAYRSTAFTMVEIGKHFRVSDKTVSRAVRRHECPSDHGAQTSVNKYKG
jgi:putative transposase